MPKLRDVRAGDILVADAGFDCLDAGGHEVKEDDGGLYVSCVAGKHYLAGQHDARTGELVGLTGGRK